MSKHDEHDEYDWTTDDRIPVEALDAIDDMIARLRWAWCLIGFVLGVIAKTFL